MSTIEYKTHISSDGTLTPISDWPGGEADAVLVVRQPEQTRENEPIDDDWRPDPSAVRELLEWRKPLIEERRADKKSMEDFITFFTNGPVSDVSDEEIEKAKDDYLMEKYG